MNSAHEILGLATTTVGISANNSNQLISPLVAGLGGLDYWINEHIWKNRFAFELHTYFPTLPVAAWPGHACAIEAARPFSATQLPHKPSVFADLIREAWIHTDDRGIARLDVLEGEVKGSAHLFG
jgi:hypothetical protein